MAVPSSADGTSTPSGEPGDDFFSSWDKPTINRPSNPPSRTQTPPIVSRTASPFLHPGTNSSAPARPKSPLIESESSQAPTASRTISSSAIRKSTTSGAPRKTNVLGAKKTQKLGAKRVGGSESVDFEEAERKAKEEADRIEKLGYDPDAEAAAASSAKSLNLADKSKIASPTPLKPTQVGYGAASTKERNAADVERLGMGLGRLGFGQTGGAKPPAPAPKKTGFGAVGASRAVEEGEFFDLDSRSCVETKFSQKMMTVSDTRGQNLALRKAFLRMSSSTKASSIRPHNQKPSRVCKDLRGHRQSRVTHISVDQRTTFPKPMNTAIMAIWREQQEISCASLGSRRETISII